MKLLKILLALYQTIIVALSTFAVFLCISFYFRPAPNVTYHWPNIILLILFLAPTIIFCCCNAIKLFLPARNIFAKFKGVFPVSIVFTVLWTLLFGYLLIFQTGSGSCQTSPARVTPKVSSKVDPPQTEQMAPDFNVTDQFGNMISLSKLRGKIVLLDFWGVWCGPCRRKLPHTQKMHDEFKDKGLVVIGIHSAFRTEKTAAFLTENNYTFPTGIDPGHIAKDYAVTGWPTYYLIDKKGRLAWGPKHAPPSEKLIESLLKD